MPTGEIHEGAGEEFRPNDPNDIADSDREFNASLHRFDLLQRRNAADIELAGSSNLTRLKELREEEERLGDLHEPILRIRLAKVREEIVELKLLDAPRQGLSEVAKEIMEQNLRRALKIHKVMSDSIKIVVR